MPSVPSISLETNLKSFYKVHVLMPKNKKFEGENTKEGCFFVSLLSPLRFLPRLPLSPPLSFPGVCPAARKAPYSTESCIFKCRSLKGIAANGSVAWQGLNYLNEEHSKKCMLGFFSFHNSTPICIFPLLIEINFPCCFVLQNTWSGYYSKKVIIKLEG